MSSVDAGSVNWRLIKGFHNYHFVGANILFFKCDQRRRKSTKRTRDVLTFFPKSWHSLLDHSPFPFANISQSWNSAECWEAFRFRSKEDAETADERNKVSLWFAPVSHVLQKYLQNYSVHASDYRASRDNNNSVSALRSQVARKCFMHHIRPGKKPENGSAF